MTEPVIGVYDYTVILTYLSLISAAAGTAIVIGGGNIAYAVLCLMLSGLLDGFDGRVARSKKNRTEEEKQFGIQIDSLTDIVAFGVLPAAIGVKLLTGASFYSEASPVIRVLLLLPAAWYVLAAMIRLAWFNVSEEERQKKYSKEHRQVFYTGLPVTTSSLLFPLLLLICRLCGTAPALWYDGLLLAVAFAFVLRFSVPKPGIRSILTMVGIGAVIILLAIFF